MSAALFQPEAIAKAPLRRPLLSSCAIAAALVASGHGAQVRAQAFQAGAPVQVSGSTIRNITSPTTETITIDTDTAVLNWTPTDTAIGGGAIDYLPSGNVATFQGGANVSNFTILNRIIPADPTRAVAFNGTALSLVGAVSPVTGGSVWFYSPGGIIAGATAVFDVGSLVLTANDLNDLDVGGNVLHFRGGTDSRSAVTINPGAQINATQPGSYVALVAPRVSQGGTVTVDGSVAYVAAESVDITINGGLFDFAIQTGSAVNAGGETTLTHTGTTTGPSPISNSDPQSIFMVAMPKNDAITMLVSGTAGYQPAGGAVFENGAVNLIAGHSFTSADQGLGNAVPANLSTPPGQNASINITGGNFTSRVYAQAVTDATATGTLDFTSALDLRAGRLASLTANAGQIITIAGSVGTMTFSRDNTGADSAGQAIFRAANGGRITVQGGASAVASSNGTGIAGSALFEATNGSTLDFGRESFVYADGAGFLSGTSSQGGTARINISNSTFTVGERVQVTANGFGADGSNGGNGTGGSASASFVNSTVNITGSLGQGLFVSANGEGGGGTVAGIGQGGAASVSIDDTALTIGTITVPADLTVQALGSGGNGFSGGTSGAGIGGTATVNILDSTPDPTPAIVTVNGNIGLSANGSGGSIEFGYGSGLGGVGANGTGGTATFNVSNGTVTANSVSIFADGSGGSGGEVGYGQPGNGGDGGDGTGGTASFIQSGGDMSTASMDIGASGFGGSGGSAGSSLSGTGGIGGDGIGGLAAASSTGGTLNISSSLFLFAQGGGGSGAYGSGFIETAPGGAGRGGTARLSVSGGTTTLASFNIDATGRGGSSFLGSTSGEGRGGTAEAILTNIGSTLNVTDGGTLNASALFSGEGGSPGNSFGGTATIFANDGAALNHGGGTIRLSADSQAGASPLSGEGSDATGGTARIATNGGGTITSGGLFEFSAVGVGGDGNDSGDGGDSLGGNASLFNGGGTIDIASVSMDVTGTGGSSFESGYGAGLSAGNGGAGIGGTAQLLAGGGDTTVDLLSIAANGLGGNGGDLFSVTGPGGNGGTGTGGSITVGTSGGTLAIGGASIFSGSSGLSALGIGGSGGFANDGNGGAGGNGTAGQVTLTASDSALDLSATPVSILVSADGGAGGSTDSGGSGGIGGAATGGTARFTAAGTDGALTIDSTNLTILNVAIGGNGGSGGFGATGGRGGDGGGATGGTIEMATNLGTVSIDGLGSGGPFFLTTGVGGNGGDGGSGSDVGDTGGDGGNGGAGTGGIIRVNVNGGAVNLGSPQFFAHGNGGFGGLGGTGAGTPFIPGDPTAIPPIPDTLAGPETPASNGFDADGFGGTISIVVNDNDSTGAAGSATFGDSVFHVAGFINDRFENIFDDIGGRIEISDNGTAAGGGIEFANLNALSTGFSPTTDQAIDVFGAERRINIIGDANFGTGGPVYFRAAGNGGLDVGGSLNVSAGSFIFVQHDSQPATPVNTIDAGNFSAFSSSDFTAFADSRINSAGAINIASDFGAIDVNIANAGSTINLNALGNVTGGSLSAGGDVNLSSSAGAVLVSNDLVAGGVANAFGTGITLNALGDLDIGFAQATTGNFVVNSGGSLGVAIGNAAGDVVFTTADDVTISDVVSGNNLVQIGSGGEVTVTGTGQVRSDGDIEMEVAGDVRVLAGGVIGLGAVAPSSGGLSPERLGGPADSVAIGSGQSLFVDGLIVGLGINLFSSDISIGSGAQIGDLDTTSLSFFNSGNGRTFIGGAGGGGGYSLSNTEFSRIQAQQIGIFGSSSSSTAGPELVVQDLDIAGSASSSPNLIGPDASLFIQSPNRMRIEGNVALTSAGSNDRLGFSAGNRIDLITPSGSIVATAPGGALAGTISMSANRIFVGSDAAAADIASLSTTDEIDERLGTNDGPVNTEGYLQADTLDFDVFQSLYIQNSGSGLSPAERAGFTAGGGGVTIDAGEGGSIAIVINGRQSSEGIVTGADLIPLLRINGSVPPPTSGFDLRSTANGCLIVGMSCRFDMETPSVPPVQDVIDEIVTPPGGEANNDGTALVQALNLPLIQLVDLAGLAFAPLIDEPVTGAGNDDFWIGDGEKDKNGPGK